MFRGLVSVVASGYARERPTRGTVERTATAEEGAYDWSAVRPGAVLRSLAVPRDRRVGGATIALVAVSAQLGNETNDSSSLPGTNSQQATSTLQKPFPAIANGTSPIIFHAPTAGS